MKGGKEALCPTYPNQGRIYFSLKGSHCQEKVRVSYMDKIENCKNTCNFYQQLHS